MKAITIMRKLDLRYCDKITDASVIEIAKGCSQLTSIDLRYCDKITDASLNVLENETSADVQYYQTLVNEDFKYIDHYFYLNFLFFIKINKS